MTNSTTNIPILDDDAVVEIEALYQKATPGPLDARLGSGQNVCTALASQSATAFDEFVCDVLPDYVCKPGMAQRWEANRDFIERAYSAVPALCQTVRVLRDSEARLQEQVVRLAELAETRSDLIAAKGAHVDHLQSQLEQVTKERDDYRRRLKEWEL